MTNSYVHFDKIKTADVEYSIITCFETKHSEEILRVLFTVKHKRQSPRLNSDINHTNVLHIYQRHSNFIEYSRLFELNLANLQARNYELQVQKACDQQGD